MLDKNPKFKQINQYYTKMLQRKHPDYLMKRFEELAKVLARLFGLKESGETSAIITASEETLDELFGEEDEPLKSTADLLNWLAEGKLGQQDLINLSDIWYERAEALHLENRKEEARVAYQHALTCMNFTLETEKVFPFHWANRIEYIKNKAQAEE